MSPEVEAQKVIAISLGKIASSRIQRGGPKLCKNLLVANLIHKARNFVDDQFHSYYPSFEQVSSTPSDVQISDSTGDSHDEMTEVSCESDEMPSGSRLPDDYAQESSSRTDDSKDSPDRTDDYSVKSSAHTEHDDKENDSPDMCLDSSDVPRNPGICRTRLDKPRTVPSRCLKRRNSCSERRSDYETHRSPSKRLCDQRHLKVSVTADALDIADNSDTESEFSVDGMDVEQISTLVSAFSNSFRDFTCVSYSSSDSESVPERSPTGCLWRSNSVPEMALCAQQATNVLKMRQQVFETPVLA